MTAPARPGFNADAWFGRKPLVEHPKVPIRVGCVCWEKTPEQAQVERETGETVEDSGDNTIEQRRGGIVVKVTIDPDTGEQTVTLLESRMRQRRYEVFTVELNASEIDGYTIEDRTPLRMHQAVLQICRALGENLNGYVTGYRRYLLEVAVELLVVADEDAAALTARRDAHEAARLEAAGETSWEENRG